VDVVESNRECCMNGAVQRTQTLDQLVRIFLGPAPLWGGVKQGAVHLTFSLDTLLMQRLLRPVSHRAHPLIWSALCQK
jgi:hypothetical protein